MLLMTGGTGFVGRAVLRHLAEQGLPVRTLLRPSPRSPQLPRGVATEVALAALSDRRGLRAALVGVDVVIHLAGSERRGQAADLETVDVQGTENLVEAAADAGVRRIVYVSHLGAELASAYPLLRAKARAEEAIRHSGVPFTILRSGLLFGPGDAFTTWLAMLAAMVPLLFPIPGDGTTLLQPLWVEDLATALAWSLEDERTIGQRIDIGGPEFLTVKEVVGMVLAATRQHRTLLPVPPRYLRAAAWVLSTAFPSAPVNILWFDYLAVSRTAELATLPRIFGLQPARMETRLEHLHGRHWGRELLRRPFRPRGGKAA